MIYRHYSIEAICNAAHSDKPVKWLCEQRNGTFVRNTALEFDDNLAVAHLAATRRIIKEFSELLNVLSDSYKQDDGISIKSAQKIRKEWEDVKRASERLVRACERGEFVQPGPISE